MLKDFAFILSLLNHCSAKTSHYDSKLFTIASKAPSKIKTLNQLTQKMSESYPMGSLDDAHLFEFDDAWYENDDSLSPINDGPPIDLDQEWDEIAYQIEAEAALLMQEYEQQQSAAPPLEANNGEVSIMANPEQSTLRSGYRGHRGALDDAGFLEGVREYLDHEGVIDFSSGIQFSPNQVTDFLQDPSRVVIGTIEKDDQNCPICRSEYGEVGGDRTEPGSDSAQGLPVEDAPEYPVKLPCGHLFGNCCIKKWLLEQPASCPLCRSQFLPVGWIDDSP